MRIQFHLEAEFLQSVNNSYIPLFYEVTEDAYYYYLVEEYIEGTPLDIFLFHQNHISLTFLLNIGIECCGFFEFLHNQLSVPVIYRDLKPEHIIVCGNEIRIIDFGSVLYFTGKGNKCQNFGTPGFAAPEQYRKTSLQDERTDLYGLGTVLSFLMCYLPNGEYKNLKKIIKKATQKKKSERFHQAADMKKALVTELNEWKSGSE